MGVNGINTSNSLDLAFGVIAFIPGGGAISGTYFLINLGLQATTGQNLGQHIDNLIK